MNTYHVYAENDQWVLKEDGAADVLIEASSREELIRETCEYMKLRRARVLIHDAAGQVEEERSYPREGMCG